MGKPFPMRSSVKLVASTEPAAAAGVPDPETPFRILVLGDFRGRGERGLAKGEPGTIGEPVRIDRDNFEEVMARLGVGVGLTAGGDGLTRVALTFAEIDDFHPDQIYARAEVFRALRRTRTQLSDPATFAEAAAALVGGPGAEARNVGPAVGAPPAAPQPAPADLFDQIVRSTARSEGAGGRSGDGWDAFLAKITAPHRVARAEPRQAELVASVDSATGDLMRAILHDPEFQALEAAWRGLLFLSRRLETGPQLELFLAHVTRSELADDLRGERDLRATATYKSLIEPSVGMSGGQPWGVIVGNMTFGPDPGDTALLGRTAGLARLAGAPFLAAADPRILGCTSLAATPDSDDWRVPPDGASRDAWQALRAHGDAAYLGLALPRFLLRLPYTRGDYAIDSFDFEELCGDPGHEAYLWGNPAFALAEILGQAFSHEGWGMRPGDDTTVDDLPLHTHTVKGVTEVVPCGEAWLSDRAADVVLDRGLMPFLTKKGRDVIRLVQFQSIAEPPCALAGRWS